MQVISKPCRFPPLFGLLPWALVGFTHPVPPGPTLGVTFQGTWIGLRMSPLHETPPALEGRGGFSLEESALAAEKAGELRDREHLTRDVSNHQSESCEPDGSEERFERRYLKH